MAATLEWVRDNYDTNKDRYIDRGELIKATDDYFDDKITLEELNAVIAANEKQTLLPAYTSPTGVTLEWVRDNYDTITRDRYIDAKENLNAIDDYFDDKITLEQQAAVQAAHDAQTQLPAYPSPPPTNGGIDPILATPDVRSLEAGKYNIIVTKSDYNTVYAKITVDSGGNVSCDSVTGGACGGTGYPRVVASGTSVKVHMASAAPPAIAKCTWIATKDTSKVAFISELILAYNHIPDLTFPVLSKEISDGILMYNNLGTPQTLWGC